MINNSQIQKAWGVYGFSWFVTVLMVQYGPSDLSDLMIVSGSLLSWVGVLLCVVSVWVFLATKKKKVRRDFSFAEPK